MGEVEEVEGVDRVGGGGRWCTYIRGCVNVTTVIPGLLAFTQAVAEWWSSMP